MALARYVIVKAVTVPQGTLSAAVAGEPGTARRPGSAASARASATARSRRPLCPGTPILLDSASPLYSYLNGQGALRAYVQAATT
jgi:hypothetical protein